jgi:hypothetical protein
VKSIPGSTLSTVGLQGLLVLAAAAFSGTAPAQGTAPVFSVNKVECDWLDEAEFTRLLELELALVGSGEDLPPLSLDLSCGEQWVTIVVRDPEWTQQIERTVPSPEIEGPGRERQIALTVAQFAGALWRLREAEEQEAAEQREPDEPDAGPEPPVAQPPTSSALLSGFGELSAAVWLVERFGVVALLAFEGANADRDGGSVGAVAVTGGLGLAGMLTEVGRFRLESRLLLAGGYARFEGRADDPSSHADGSTDGGAGEVRVELAPSLELGRLQLALVVQGGYALPVTIAVVRADDDVSLAGWWVGAGLRIGVGFVAP